MVNQYSPGPDMEDCSNCSLSMSLIQNKLVIKESSHSRECRERNIEYRQNYQKRGEVPILEVGRFEMMGLFGLL